MKKKKLPSNYKVRFFSKGDFITCATDLTSNGEALVPGDRSIFRSARFDIKDFQAYVNRKYDDGEKILFSADYWHKTWAGKYISSDTDFDKKGMKALLETFDCAVVHFLRLDFSGITVWKLNHSGKSTKVVEKEFIPGLDAYNLNNLYFDPYTDFNGGTPDEAYLKIFREVLKNTKLDPDLDIILAGEFVWGNDMTPYICELVNQKNLRSARIYIDYSGIFHGLISDSGHTTQIAYLHRDFFYPDIVYSSRLPEKGLDIYRDGVQNKVTLNKGSLNLVEIKRGEVCDVFSFGDRGGILLYGKGNLDIIKTSNRDRPIHKSAQALMREDKVVQYCDEEIKFFREDRQVSYIKIFDYSQINAVKNVKLKIVDGEYLSRKQEICRYSKPGSMLEKRFFSPVNGVADLSSIRLGYVTIIKDKEKGRKVKNQAYIKVRGRAVFGKNVYGVLGDDVFYVSNLDKEVFEKFIQKGAKALICRTICKKMFRSIIEYNLFKLVTVAIIEGIDLEVPDGFIMDSLDGFNIFVNEESNSLNIGLPQKRINFYRDKKGGGLSVPEEYLNEAIYRVGSKIRLLHRDHWGEYARIVDVDNSKSSVKLSSKYGVSESSFINLA